MISVDVTEFTLPISLDRIEIAGRYHQRRNDDEEWNRLLLLRRGFFPGIARILITLKLCDARRQDGSDSSVFLCDVSDHNTIASHSLLQGLAAWSMYQ